MSVLLRKDTGPPDDRLLVSVRYQLAKMTGARRERYYGISHTSRMPERITPMRPRLDLSHDALAVGLGRSVAFSRVSPCPALLRNFTPVGRPIGSRYRLIL
jgi:hypothetical protein